MTRYRLTVEYDGTPFQGWQRQADGPSVQAALETAVRDYSGESVQVHGSGRTDTGVHALGQVAHLDLARRREPESVRMGLNFHLVRATAGTVVVLDCVEAPDDFHARFSAVERRYLYRLLTRPSPPAFGRNQVWWMPHPLDDGAMGEAAKPLVGHHDFTSFRAAGCQADSPLRTLSELRVTRAGAGITVHARAPSFLYRQVRILVGTLAEVGLGREDVDAPRRALAARDRTAAGPTAPARGLYFETAMYVGDQQPG